jgi:hypothetical protein
MVLRFWGRTDSYDPNFGGPGWKPEEWGNGPGCRFAPSRGVIEVFLKRFRDGQWVRSWREAGVVAGPDGGPQLELGPLQVSRVREEELPFELVPNPDPRSSSGVYVLDRPLPPTSFWVPRGFCLQPGAGWPWNATPVNTFPTNPPLAPEAPPAYFFSYGMGLGGPLSIIYIDGEYEGRMYSGWAYKQFALPPRPDPYRIVIYGTWTYPTTHPYHHRWVRVYTRQPLAVRLEGGRLVCENGDEPDWVYEMMPEGFSFPGFMPEQNTFDVFNTPYNLPSALDPYQEGR